MKADMKLRLVVGGVLLALAVAISLHYLSLWDAETITKTTRLGIVTLEGGEIWLEIAINVGLASVIGLVAWEAIKKGRAAK